MKRMYVVLGALLLLVLSFGVLAQQSREDSRDAAFKRAMELREELHRRLKDHLFNGLGNNKDIFNDMETLFEDVMGDININSSKKYDMAWTESKEGRTLLLSPHDKSKRLEISVEKGMVSIKGSSEASSFSHSYSVPQDCDSSKVKMLEKDGKILMSFPYKKIKQERKPIPHSSSDVTI